MKSQRAIDAVLFDLDGVLYVGDESVPGAVEALAAVRALGLPCRFITNTSTSPADAVAGKLRAMGFDVEGSEIFSAVSATRDFLLARGRPSVHLLIGEAVRGEFAGFPQPADAPDIVIVGDIGAAWDYPLLNRVFNELMAGARLVAMHKNRYWQTPDGLRMDIGAFVAGLEYVSGRQATIIGKPSREFFQLAVDSVGAEPARVVIVGDDIENDIGGGQAAGLRGVLVRTGKFRKQVLAASAVNPDAVLDSVAALPDWLAR